MMINRPTEHYYRAEKINATSANVLRWPWRNNKAKHLENFEQIQREYWTNTKCWLDWGVWYMQDSRGMRYEYTHTCPKYREITFKYKWVLTRDKSCLAWIRYTNIVYTCLFCVRLGYRSSDRNMCLTTSRTFLLPSSNDYQERVLLENWLHSANVHQFCIILQIT